MINIELIKSGILTILIKTDNKGLNKLVYLFDALLNKEIVMLGKITYFFNDYNIFINQLFDNISLRIGKESRIILNNIINEIYEMIIIKLIEVYKIDNLRMYIIKHINENNSFLELDEDFYSDFGDKFHNELLNEIEKIIDFC